MTNIQILWLMLILLLFWVSIIIILFYKDFKIFKWDYAKSIIDVGIEGKQIDTYYLKKNLPYKIWILLKGDILPCVAYITYDITEDIITGKSKGKFIITVNKKIIDYDIISKWQPMENNWKKFNWYYLEYT